METHFVRSICKEECQVKKAAFNRQNSDLPFLLFVSFFSKILSSFVYVTFTKHKILALTRRPTPMTKSLREASMAAYFDQAIIEAGKFDQEMQDIDFTGSFRRSRCRIGRLIFS